MGTTRASRRRTIAPTKKPAARAGLAEYKRKRDFSRTPEPAPRPARSATRRSFVIQKHRATALHYDFRLEIGDAMPSWAVPKGPSLDPSQKRLAMQVEDHPLEYAGFEGVIPAGEYGGGTVMIWDEGTYEMLDDVDPAVALKKGELRFTLNGRKLKGRWTLVRTGPRKWLLIKGRDAEADTTDVTVAQPRSVRTNRLLAEIARDEGGDVDKAATGDPAVSKTSGSAKR
ncbi:MAG TPA: DNA polymerase ligase N-terminal domain-containing protein [Candidatus Limnocylindria bacterium]